MSTFSIQCLYLVYGLRCNTRLKKPRVEINHHRHLTDSLVITQKAIPALGYESMSSHPLSYKTSVTLIPFACVIRAVLVPVLTSFYYYPTSLLTRAPPLYIIIIILSCIIFTSFQNLDKTMSLWMVLATYTLPGNLPTICSKLGFSKVNVKVV